MHGGVRQSGRVGSCLRDLTAVSKLRGYKWGRPAGAFSFRDLVSVAVCECCNQFFHSDIFVSMLTE